VWASPGQSNSSPGLFLSETRKRESASFSQDHIHSNRAVAMFLALEESLRKGEKRREGRGEGGRERENHSSQRYCFLDAFL
jgi:hypothetical protein